jgi:hypothetical protein
MAGAKDDPKVTRRDTLRLATAVSALGAGLGVSLDPKGALAESIKGSAKLAATDIGTVALKIVRLPSGGPPELLHTFDLTAHFLKLDALKGESIKFSVYNQKEGAATPLFEQTVTVTQIKKG